MCFENGSFVWFNNFASDDYKNLYKHNDVTWIKSHKAKWRPAEEYLGEKLVYINRDNIEQ